MAIPSHACLIIGCVGVCNHRKATGKTRSGANTNYDEYDCGIFGINDVPPYPGILRQWAGPATPRYEDGTVLFTLSKMVVPPTGDRRALVESIVAVPFGGDPRDPKYDENIPFVPPFIVSAGHCASALNAQPDGVHRAFRLLTGEYVRGQNTSFDLM